MEQEPDVKRKRGRPPKRKRPEEIDGTLAPPPTVVSAPSTPAKPIPRTPTTKKSKKPLSLKKKLKQRPYLEEEDSEDDSAEERAYQKSIKDRMILADLERRESVADREKWEQQRLNAAFFRQSQRQSSEEHQKKVQKQQLVVANLFMPPEMFRLRKEDVDAYRKADLEEQRRLKAEKKAMVDAAKQEIIIPRFEEITIPEDTPEESIYTKFFADEYSKGLIKTVEPEVIEIATPRRVREYTHPTSSYGTRRARGADARFQKMSRIDNYLHPVRWAEPELQLFEELVYLHGQDWSLLSGLLGKAKTPQRLEKTYAKGDGDLSYVHTVDFVNVICGVCNEPGSKAPIVFCSCCDRGYHITCTDPPLAQIPTESEWYCCAECTHLSQTNCQVCGSSSDEDAMLLCDRCNKGYHTYCLPEPLAGIPDGDWYCTGCAKQQQAQQLNAKIHGGKRSPSSARTANGVASVGDEPAVQQNRYGGVVCDHHAAVDNSAAALKTRKSIRTTIIYTPPVDATARASVESAIPIPWKVMLILARQCVDCMVSSAHGIMPKSVPLIRQSMHEGSLPELFRRSVFSIQFGDLFNLRGIISEEAAMNHFKTLLAATESAIIKAIAHPIFSMAQGVDILTEKSRKKRSRQNMTPGSPAVKTDKFGTPVRSGAIGARKVVHTGLKASGKKKLKPNADGDHPTPIRKPTQSSHNSEEFNREDGYAEKESRYWIFQANPQLYDIYASVMGLPDMTWFVKQHINRIRNNDKVFIWESGKNAGVIATGTVTSDPANIPEARAMKQYTHHSALFDTVTLRCHVHVNQVLPEKLHKADFRNHPILGELTILRAPIGTNFRITKSQGLAIEQLVTETMRKGGVVHPGPGGENLPKARTVATTQIAVVAPSPARAATITSSAGTNHTLAVTPGSPMQLRARRATTHYSHIYADDDDDEEMDVDIISEEDEDEDDRYRPSGPSSPYRSAGYVPLPATHANLPATVSKEDNDYEEDEIVDIDNWSGEGSPQAGRSGASVATSSTSPSSVSLRPRSNRTAAAAAAVALQAALHPAPDPPNVRRRSQPPRAAASVAAASLAANMARENVPSSAPSTPRRARGRPAAIVAPNAIIVKPDYMSDDVNGYGDAIEPMDIIIPEPMTEEAAAAAASANVRAQRRADLRMKAERREAEQIEKMVLAQAARSLRKKKTPPSSPQGGFGSDDDFVPDHYHHHSTKSNSNNDRGAVSNTSLLSVSPGPPLPNGAHTDNVYSGLVDVPVASNLCGTCCGTMVDPTKAAVCSICNTCYHEPCAPGTPFPFPKTGSAPSSPSKEVKPPTWRCGNCPPAEPGFVRCCVCNVAQAIAIPVNPGVPAASDTTELLYIDDDLGHPNGIDDLATMDTNDPIGIAAPAPSPLPSTAATTDPDERVLTCSCCALTYHVKCLDMSKEEMDTTVDGWTCPSCVMDEVKYENLLLVMALREIRFDIEYYAKSTVDLILQQHRYAISRDKEPAKVMQDLAEGIKTFRDNKATILRCAAKSFADWRDQLQKRHKGEVR